MTNNTDLILKPLKGMRGKRYDTLKGCTVEAFVDLTDNMNSDYDHPLVTLKRVRQYDTGERSETALVTVRFQRHNVNGGRSWRSDLPSETAARGFLRGRKGHWSYSYGAEVRGDLDHVNYLTTGLTLIERAYEAIRKDEALNRKISRCNDQLLRLIVGLRKVGITVNIRDAKPGKRVNQYSLVAA